MRALGIDVGSTTTKVVLIEVTAERVTEVAVQSSPTPARAQDLLAAIAAACRALTSGDDRVTAVGVASMAETGVPVGADGEPLTELLRWDAGLGAADAAELAEKAPAVFAASGVRLSAKTPLTTWRWLRRERAEVWRSMRTWLGAADLVVHAFTGAAVTDHTLAGRTGGYRLAAPDQAPPPSFDAELLAIAGLEPARLPRVAGPQEIAGRVTPAAASVTGLPTGLPVTVAGHDHQVAAWAAGVRSPGEVADSLGTAEAALTVLAERPDPEWVQQQGMSLVRTVGGVADALVSGSSSAGAMLDHWLRTVPPEQRQEVLAVAAQEAIAAQRPTGAAVVPYLRGRQTPEPDPTAQAEQPPSGWPRSRQARAVVEGICYQARWMIETQLGSQTPRSVAVIGGDRLPLVWTQLKRATLPWPVTWVRASEPVAVGAGVLALVRAGAPGDPGDALERGPTLDLTSQPPLSWDPHAEAYDDFVRRARRRP